MKIKCLVFKNIASFKKEIFIDFSVFYNNLFLISGDTGSGKTTIIDTILIALYDKTPRLINTKEIVNKDCNSAYIKLEFFIKKDFYILNWQIKKDRKKRELFKNNELIADKSKQINNEIKNILNLDFSEFTKSVILAQGEFNAFLDATSLEKTKVLENIIPNIKKYEFISKKIFEDTKNLKQDIENLKLRLQDIKEEAIKEKEIEIKNLIDYIQNLEEKKDKLIKNNNLLKQKKELISDINRLNKDIEKIEKEIKEFKKYDLSNIEKYNKQIEFLNQKILLEEEINSLEKEYNKRQKNLNNNLDKEYRYKNELISKEREFKDIIIFSSKELDNFDNISKIYYKIQDLKEEYLKNKQQKDKIENIMSNKLKELDILKKDYNELKEYFEYLEAKEIVLKYEEDRKYLRENEPCPLCGSINHPFIHNPPISSSKYKDTKAKLLSFEEKILKLEKEINTNKIKLENINLDIIKDNIDNFKQKLLIKEEDFDNLLNQINHNKKYIPIKNNLKLEIEKLKVNLENLDINIEKDKKELKDLEKNLDNKKQNRYIKAKEEKDIIQKKYNKLLEIDKQLFNKENILNNTLKDLKIKKEVLSKIVVKDLDYEKEIKEINNILNTSVEKKGSLLAEVKYLKDLLLENKKIKEEINNKNKKFLLYEKINQKIGSKEGDKFKKIVINYMMDSLLNVCNEHLDILSDNRYILEKSEDVNKLDLFIKDRWYGNITRSINTLSGGEKFLVSLSLAFGLSSILQSHIKIETMFLDEGFGTLSEDVLSLVLNRLYKASSKNTIGIVSHIDILKEEISKQIQVIKQSKTSYIKIK